MDRRRPHFSTTRPPMAPAMKQAALRITFEIIILLAALWYVTRPRPDSATLEALKQAQAGLAQAQGAQVATVEKLTAAVAQDQELRARLEKMVAGGWKVTEHLRAETRPQSFQGPSVTPKVDPTTGLVECPPPHLEVAAAVETATLDGAGRTKAILGTVAIRMKQTDGPWRQNLTLPLGTDQDLDGTLEAFTFQVDPVALPPADTFQMTVYAGPVFAPGDFSIRAGLQAFPKSWARQGAGFSLRPGIWADTDLGARNGPRLAAGLALQISRR